MTSNSNGFSLDSVRKMTRRPTALKVEAYVHIYGELGKLIQNRASQGHFEIMYTIPRFILGFPPYKVLECASYLHQRLQEEGFEVSLRALNRGADEMTVRVCWRMSLAEEKVLERREAKTKTYNFVNVKCSSDEQGDTEMAGQQRGSRKLKKNTYTVKEKMQNQPATMNFLHNSGVIDELPVNKKSSIYL